jgi:hypothetical protein
MFGSDVAFPYRVATNADVNDFPRGIDIDGGLRRPGDRNVSRAVDSGLDIGHCRVNPDSVEEFSSLWHGDGCQHRNDAQREDDLYCRKPVSRSRLTSLGLAVWIAYGKYVLCR